MNLRDYQIDMLNGAINALNAGKSPFVTSPTGSGKMVVIASLAAHLQMKVLIVEHRQELIDQAMEKLREIGENPGLIMSGVADPNKNATIKVGMIQTINRRDLGGWEPDVIIVDEAHLGAAASYKKLFQNCPDSPRVLFSATPWRLDGKGFRDICDVMVLGPTIRQLIQKKFLVPTEYFAYDMADFSNCKIVGNEYDQDEVAVIMSDITEEIVETWLGECKERPTIVFAANTKHSKSLCEAFRARGIKAEHVDGSTPNAVRKSIMRRLKNGETRVLCNCGVVVEGFDAPLVSCVILAIATKSLSKFLQCCGRGMRPHTDSGKKNLIVMDFGGCHKTHGVPEDDRTWTLENRNIKPHKSEFVEEIYEAVEVKPITTVVYKPDSYDYGKDGIALDEVARRNYVAATPQKPAAPKMPVGGKLPPTWLPVSWRDYWINLEAYRLALRLPPEYSERVAKSELQRRRMGL